MFPYLNQMNILNYHKQCFKNWVISGIWVSRCLYIFKLFLSNPSEIYLPDKLYFKENPPSMAHALRSSVLKSKNIVFPVDDKVSGRLKEMACPQSVSSSGALE